MQLQHTFYKYIKKMGRSRNPRNRLILKQLNPMTHRCTKMPSNTRGLRHPQPLSFLASSQILDSATSSVPSAASTHEPLAAPPPPSQPPDAAVAAQTTEQPPAPTGSDPASPSSAAPRTTASRTGPAVCSVHLQIFPRLPFLPLSSYSTSKLQSLPNPKLILIGNTMLFIACIDKGI